MTSDNQTIVANTRVTSRESLFDYVIGIWFNYSDSHGFSVSLGVFLCDGDGFFSYAMSVTITVYKIWAFKSYKTYMVMMMVAPQDLQFRTIDNMTHKGYLL